MASEFKKKLFWRAVVAEFLAMTLFVFISIGSALGFNYPLKNNQTSGATQDNVKVSLAFGLSIATLAQSVGHISGAHLNPAVTLGLLLSCQISILRAVMYIIAQCVGAIVATAILSGITSSLSNNSLGRNELAPGVNSGQGLGIEIIGTLQLVLCVLATTDRRRRDLGGSAPLAIGLSVALGHLLAIDYTGCGINPARSFGSAVISHNFKDHWIFWVGPFIGGALAVLIYDFILAPRNSDITDRMKGQLSTQSFKPTRARAGSPMGPQRWQKHLDIQKQQDDQGALNSCRPITTSAQGLLTHLTDKKAEAQCPTSRS
ncbi:aquaporin-1 isoform X1 [Pteropus alecto]|uniref:aquaporin-1 isoform X1 n=1 Tax=Pteropus alecto TaxID=9402 RepID=UPI00076877F8|nr:aquaporin-1 isoform X1 [Pteropus alecto]